MSFLSGLGKVVGSVLGLSTGTVGGAVASSLIGGVLGGRGGSEQRTVNSVDYVALRDSAEKAGFNPLTALQNGGSAGFGTSVTTVPALTGSQLLKQAAADGVRTWFNRDQIALDRERAQLENAILRKELAGLEQSQGVLRSRDLGFSIPNSPFTVGAGFAGPNGNGASQVPALANTPPSEDTVNMYVRVWDPDNKRYVRVLNPALTDSGPTEMATAAAMLSGADAAQNNGPGVLGTFKNWASLKWDGYMAKREQALPPEDGWHNSWWGSWRRRPSTPSDKPRYTQVPANGF